MNDYLVVSSCLLFGSLHLFVLGRIRVLNDKVYIPVWLSSFIFAGFYGLQVSRPVVIQCLGFRDKTNDLLFYDFGNGLLGLLPLSLAMVLIGKYLLNINYQEQWSGTTRFKLASLKYGLISGLLLAAVPLLLNRTFDQTDHIRVVSLRAGALSNLIPYHLYNIY